MLRWRKWKPERVFCCCFSWTGSKNFFRIKLPSGFLATEILSFYPGDVLLVIFIFSGRSTGCNLLNAIFSFVSLGHRDCRRWSGDLDSINLIRWVSSKRFLFFKLTMCFHFIGYRLYFMVIYVFTWVSFDFLVCFVIFSNVVKLISDAANFWRIITQIDEEFKKNATSVVCIEQ